MSDTVNDVAKVLLHITPKQFIGLLILLICGLAGVAIYEKYTYTFTLSRMDRAAEVITKLNKLKVSSTNDPSVYKARETVLSNLEMILKVTPKHTQPSRIARFAVAYLPWLIIATGMLLQKRRYKGVTFADEKQKKDQDDSIAVAFVIGLCLAAIAAFVPPYGWPWFHMLLFAPLLFLAIIILIVAITFVVPEHKKKPEKAPNQGVELTGAPRGGSPDAHS